MLEYNEFTAAHGVIQNPDCKITVSITLPCFCGDEKDFFTAKRLNEFYSSAAGLLYSYAETISQTTARQIGYTCRSEVEIENEAVKVTLHITERRIYRGRKSELLKKHITHTFRGGYAVRRSINIL